MNFILFFTFYSGKTFKNIRRLTIHIRSVHEKIRKNRCNVCCKSFVYHSAALKCEAKHKGERNFKCELCDKAFYTIYDKVSHQHNHRSKKIKTDPKKRVKEEELNELKELMEDEDSDSDL
jgi:hypothetical protein